MQAPPLQRDVFTLPPPEAKLPRDHVLKIKIPHYGLVESSSCFFDAYYPVFANKLGMSSAPFDPCFLFRTDENTVTGIAGLVTDDSLNIGTPAYRNFEQKATSAFVTRSTDTFPLRFLGFLIQNTEGTIT